MLRVVEHSEYVDMWQFWRAPARKRDHGLRGKPNEGAHIGILGRATKRRCKGDVHLEDIATITGEKADGRMEGPRRGGAGRQEGGYQFRNSSEMYRD